MLDTAIETVGQLATRVGQHTLDIEKLNDLTTKNRDRHDLEIQNIRLWQARIMGILAVIVFEIPFVGAFISWYMSNKH